jgi:hypothetical protein
MLKCKEVSQLCSQELERPLTLTDRAKLGIHLMMCTGCWNFRKQMRLLRQKMHEYADGRAPSEPADQSSTGGSPDRAS